MGEFQLVSLIAIAYGNMYTNKGIGFYRLHKCYMREFEKGVNSKLYITPLPLFTHIQLV